MTVLSETTEDLSAKVNCMSLLGLSTEIGTALVGLRFIHTSNFFWGPGNGGQNELLLYVSLPI